MSLKLGDIVACRLYNTPDAKFYGDYFSGVIVNIREDSKISSWLRSEARNKIYSVKREYPPKIVDLKRKEILRRLERAE